MKLSQKTKCGLEHISWGAQNKNSRTPKGSRAVFVMNEGTVAICLIMPKERFQPGIRGSVGANLMRSRTNDRGNTVPP